MGYLLVIAAGVLQGAFVLPMKSTKKWAWENTWLVFSTAGYLIWPWLLALLTIPHPFTVLANTSVRSLALVELFGLGWGLGAIAFGLGVSRLGMALALTVIVGLAATAGALIPLVVLAPEKLAQPQGLVMLASLALVLIGLGLSSWGGKLREPEQSSTSDPAQSSFAWQSVSLPDFSLPAGTWPSPSAQHACAGLSNRARRSPCRVTPSWQHSPWRSLFAMLLTASGL